MDPSVALSGYAESWALFTMLMEERPADLRNYLARVYTNKETEDRLGDFTAVFGDEVNRIEVRLLEFAKEQVERQPRSHASR